MAPSTQPWSRCRDSERNRPSQTIPSRSMTRSDGGVVRERVRHEPAYAEVLEAEPDQLRRGLGDVAVALVVGGEAPADLGLGALAARPSPRPASSRPRRGGRGRRSRSPSSSITSIRSTAPLRPSRSSQSSYDVGCSGIHSATSLRERIGEDGGQVVGLGGADASAGRYAGATRSGRRSRPPPSPPDQGRSIRYRPPLVGQQRRVDAVDPARDRGAAPPRMPRPSIRIPSFSMTRTEAALSANAAAVTTRRIPSPSKQIRSSARAASVASPWPAYAGSTSQPMSALGAARPVPRLALAPGIGHLQEHVADETVSQLDHERRVEPVRASSTPPRRRRTTSLPR